MNIKYITLDNLIENLKAFRDKILKKDIASATRISEKPNNAIIKEDDGFYVPSIDSDSFVKKEDGKSLIFESDIEKISDNADEITLIKRDYATKDMLTELSSKSHRHSNKSVLDELGTDEDENLTFKGNPIRGGGGSGEPSDMERETSTVDFSGYDSYEQIVMDAELNGENLVLLRTSNVSIELEDDDTTSVLGVDDVKFEVADEYVRDAINNLADNYEEGNGIKIENGIIEVI